MPYRPARFRSSGRRSPSLQTIALAAAASLSFLGLPSTRAVTDTWIGNGANTTFATGFNTTPTNGDTLVFGPAGSGGTTVTNGSALTVGAANTDGIDFLASASAYTITGSALTLASTGTGIGINDLSLNAQTISAPLTLASSQTINVGNFNGALTLSGVISGAGFTLTKTGAGLLTLSGGTNTFTNLTVTGGVVAAGGDGNFGSTTGTITLDGGTLRTTGGIALSATRGISLGDGGAGTGGTIDTNNQGSTYNGVLANNGGANSFTKTGAGTLTLGGINTYTGATIINQGTLSMDLNANPSAAINSASTLVMGGAPTVLGAVADGNLPTYTIQGNSASATGSTQTFNGLTLNAGSSRISARATSAGNTTVALGAITHNAGGTVDFSSLNGGGTGVGAFTTSNGNNNGILGGWAVINAGTANSGSAQTPTDYATVNGSNQLVAYTAYTFVPTATTLTSAAASNVRVNTTGAIALSTANGATTDINTLSLAGTATGATTVTVGTAGAGGTGILRLGASGGLFTASGSGSITVGNTANNGVLTAGGAPNTAGEITLIGSGGGSPFTINSVIADNGTGAVTLTVNQYAGNNVLALNGNNTYSGGTYLNTGRTQANTNTAFGTGPVSVSSAAQVYLNSPTFANAFNIIGVSAGNNDTPSAIRFQGGNTITGTVTLLGDATIALRGGTGNAISGRITGNGNLTIAQSGAGGGNITLSNTGNNWTGNLSTDEKIILGASNVLPDGTAAGNVFINNGGTLELNGFSDAINGLGGSATVGQGTVQNTATGASILSVGGNDQTSTFNGLITDGGAGKTLGITKTGSGLLVLGNTANAYLGGTTVNGGILRLGGTNAGTNSTIGNVAGALAVNAGATFDLNGFNQTVGAFSGTGGTVTNAGTAASTLTVGDATALTTFAGSMQNGVNALALTKQGSGTLDLTGVNTYTGATSVTAGTLQIGAGGRLAANSAVTLSGTGSLALGDGSGTVAQTFNSLTTAATTPVVGGAGAFSTLTLNNAGSTTFANVFGGTGANQNNLNVVIAGTGTTPTTIFSGLNTYTGFTQVNAGSTLNLASGSISGSALTLSSGATLTGSGNNSTTGLVGSLTASGGSAITLAGAGGTALRSGGNISLGGTGAYGAGNYTTLNYTLAGAGAVETLNTPATLTLNSGGGYVNITNPTTTGTYTLANYASLTGSGSFSLSSTTPGVTSLSLGRNTETLATNATSLVLTIAGTPAPNVAYFNGAVSSRFNDVTTSATQVNFSTNRAGTTDAGNVPSASTDVLLVANNASTNRGSTTLTATLGASTTINSLNAVSAATSGLTSFTLAADGSTLTLGGAADSNTASDSSYTGNASGNGISLASGAAPLTINVPLVIGTAGANQSWTNNSASLLTVGGTVTGSGTGAQTLTLSNTSTGGMTLSGVIANGAAGTLGVTVNNTGTGATVLGGANTYTGGTTLTAGSLRLSGGGTLGGTGGSLNVNGGTLDLNGTSQAVGNFTGTGGTILNGVTGAQTLTIGAGNGTGGNYAGVVADNAGTGGTLAVAKTGTGTLTLSGANTYSGGTTVNQGTLTSTVAGGFSTGNVTVNPTGTAGTAADAATLNTNGSIASTATVTVNSNSTTAVGTVNFNGATPAIASLLGTGNVVLNNATGTNLTIGGTNASPTFSGVIGEGTAGKGSLTKTGTGTLTLLGASTYSGGTTISGGTLVSASGTALGTNAAANTVSIGSTGTLILQSPGSFTYSDTYTGSGLLMITSPNGGSDTVINNFNAFSGTLEVSTSGNNKVQIQSGVPTALSGATLLIDNGSQFFTGGNVNFGTINLQGTGNGEGRGAIRLNGNGTTSGILGGNVFLLGNTTIGNEGGTLTGNISTGVAGISTLTMGTGNSGGTALLSGVLSNGTGTLALTQSNGTTTLSNANTYTGVTTITGGSLRLTNALAVQNSTVTNNIVNGVVFDASVTGNAFTFGALAGTANLALQNNAATPAPVALTVGAGSGTYSGALSGAGSLTQNGPGIQTLSGANTYTGATTISGGTLQMGSASALPAAALAGGAGLVINTGGTLDLNGNGLTLSAVPNGTGGAITNAGGTASTLTFSGGGTLAQSVNGNTALTVTGGILAANATSTYTGVTTITGGTLTLAKAGAAPDPNNGFLTAGGTLAGTSGITVNTGGKLVLGASNTISSGAATGGTGNGGTGVTLAGGMLTLVSGVTQGQGATVAGGMNSGAQFDVPGLGNLTLTATSSLNFAGTSGTLVFNGLTLNGNALSIGGTHFATLTGNSADGTTDRLIVETDAGAPSLAGITFANYGNSTATDINLGDGFYEIIPLNAVPEPSTWAALLLGLGAVWYGRRSRGSRPAR